MNNGKSKGAKPNQLNSPAQTDRDELTEESRSASVSDEEIEHIDRTKVITESASLCDSTSSEDTEDLKDVNDESFTPMSKFNTDTTAPSLQSSNSKVSQMASANGLGVLIDEEEVDVARLLSELSSHQVNLHSPISSKYNPEQLFVKNLALRAGVKALPVWSLSRAKFKDPRPNDTADSSFEHSYAVSASESGENVNQDYYDKKSSRKRSNSVELSLNTSSKSVNGRAKIKLTAAIGKKALTEVYEENSSLDSEKEVKKEVRGRIKSEKILELTKAEKDRSKPFPKEKKEKAAKSASSSVRKLSKIGGRNRSISICSTGSVGSVGSFGSLCSASCDEDMDYNRLTLSSYHPLYPLNPLATNNATTFT